MSELFARHYAGALHEAIHHDPALLERVVYEFERFVEVAGQNPGLVPYFNSPLVERERKLTFLAAIAKELDICGELEGLLRAIVKRSRFGSIEAILKDLKKILDSDGGVDDAVVYSARGLDAKEADEIRAHLEAVTGKRLVLQTKVDPKILGGIRAHIGYKIYDSSLSHRLELLREKMVGVAS